MKKILILAENNADFINFAKMLHTDQQIVSDFARLSDLNYDLNGGGPKITIPAARIFATNSTSPSFTPTAGQDIDLCNYDKIIVMVFKKQLDTLSRYATLCEYCKKYNISLADEPSITDPFSKLYQTWLLSLNGINVPDTAFGDVSFLGQKLEEYGGCGILKPIIGSMGSNNYLVETKDRLKQITGSEDNTNRNHYEVYLLQKYVKNALDVRIYSVNYQPKLAIVRTATTWGDGERAKFGCNLAAIPSPAQNAAPSAITSSMSAGEVQKLLPSQAVLAEMSAEAVAACRALGVGIGGVDLVWDEASGRAVVLEVNRTPQVVCKAFSEQKMSMLKDFFTE
ncbi:hypothetical protein IJ135_01175 [Candidatus Saccharibacteria bacterium]|nr:hypothetical protein [Candidatus Saccharibacteria bacterium]